MYIEPPSKQIIYYSIQALTTQYQNC